MTWLDQPDWDSLAVALLHTLWQGALMAVVLALYLAFTPTARGNRRYLASVVVLGLVLLGGFVTWSALDYSRGARAPMSSQGDSAGLGQDRQLERNEARMSPEPVGAFENEATIERGVPGSSKAQVRSFDHGKWVLRFWLAGMALMLVRLGFQLKGAEAVGGRSRSAGAESVQTLFDELRDGMGLTRRAQLRIAEGLSTPVAMGVIWPLVILPTWLLTGTPPAMLRAILAHELAHVRRHDYLVNLGQLLIETVLFFNPAVWWISRQIRIEREACCDAEAARITGNQTEYAQALADFASGAVESGAWPRAALAFGDRKSTGGLLDRIRRLVEPGYASRMRLPLRGLVVFILIGGIALAVLAQGTKLAVEAGNRLAVQVGVKPLPPQERIAKIDKIRESHSAVEPEAAFDPGLFDDPDAEATVSGRIIVEGGEGETPENISVTARSGSSGRSTSVKAILEDGAFGVTIRPGGVVLSVSSSNYAPAVVGPFRAEAGATLDNLVIPLNKGFKTRLMIQDEQGRPIDGSRITSSTFFYRSSRIITSIGGSQTIEPGVLEFPHCERGKLMLNI
jgi:beta-lactamase regulating signal transducer with metallopeptidase domain